MAGSNLRTISIWLSAIVIMSTISFIGIEQVVHGEEKADSDVRYIPHVPIRINSDGDFVAQGWPGSGTELDPWRIENISINGTGHSYCLFIGNTTDYFQVKNCHLYGASGAIRSHPYYFQFGIGLYKVQNGTILNNTLENNYAGIYLNSASNNTIQHNNASLNVGNIATYSNSCDNVFQNNTLISYVWPQRYGFGIGFQGGWRNVISYNNIKGGNVSCYFSGGYNIVENNIMSDNSFHGIKLNGADLNMLRNNTIMNTNCSVYYNYGCKLNLFYHNTLNDNNVNARDEDGNNSWDNGYPSGGNYWDDYAGVDANCDGIGDTEYSNIGGGTGVVDRYPLMEPLNGTAPSSTVNDVLPYWLNSSTVGVSATAYDDYALKNVTLWFSFSHDNASWGAWTSYNVDVGVPWEWSFDFPNGVGYYKFYSIAKDRSGKAEVVPTDVDTECAYTIESPSSNVSPLPKYWYTYSPIEINASVENCENVSYVTLHYRFSSNNKTFFSNVTYNVDTVEPYNWTFNFPYGEGYYEFYTITTDKAGNVESKPASYDVSSAYDKTRPNIVDQSAETTNTGATYLLNAQISDNLNVSAVFLTYWFDDAHKTNTTIQGSTSNYQLSIPIPSNSTTPLQYSIFFNDQAGNANSTATKVISVMDSINPTAVAGENDTVMAGRIVQLNGSASVDNIAIVNYTWTFNNSINNQTLYGVHTLVTFSAAGTYSITLYVKDAAGNIGTDLKTITITPLDSDDDGVPDVDDAFPNDPSETMDTDRDGIGDNADAFPVDPTETDDFDGDGVGDNIDAFPNDQSESIDTDSDGTGNNADPDDDGDGVPDADDPDPLDPNVTGKGGLGDYWWLVVLIVATAAVGAILWRRAARGRKPREPEA